MDESRVLGTPVYCIVGNELHIENFLLECIVCQETVQMKEVRICDSCHKAVMCHACLEGCINASHVCKDCVECPSCRDYFKCEYADCRKRLFNRKFYKTPLGNRVSVVEVADFFLSIPLKFYLDHRYVKKFWEFKVEWANSQWFIFLKSIKHNYSYLPPIAEYRLEDPSFTEQDYRDNLKAKRLKIIMMCTLLRIIFNADSNDITFPYIDLPELDLDPVCPKPFPYPVPSIEFLETGVGKAFGGALTFVV
jgi:hypothetical protein